MKRAALAAVLVSMSACHKPLDLGFAVALDVEFESSVSDAQLARVKQIVFATSGDETHSYTVTLDHAAKRKETIEYFPETTTRKLVIAVVAEDDGGVDVADGKTNELVLPVGKTLEVDVMLTPPPGITDAAMVLDAGDGSMVVELDAGGDGGPGVDATTPGVLALEGVTTYATSAAPVAVSLADVDGDKHLDVVTLSATSVDVRLGQSDGTLGPLVTTTVGSGLFLLATGDFDGDGKADLALGGSAATAVQIWTGSGTGAFTKGTALDIGATLVAIDAADLDGDGHGDVVIAAATKTMVAYSADPTKTVVYSTAGAVSQTALAHGDMNGDGKIDIISLVPAQFSVSILVNTSTMGARSFAGSVVTTETTDTGSPFVSMAVADVDGDGKTDIAVSDMFFRVDMCFGLSNGTCAPAMPVNFDVTPTQIHLADLDGDGFADLVLSEADTTLTEGVGVARFTGVGPTYSPVTIYTAGPRPGTVAIGDLDHDGRPDLVVADEDGQSVSVIYNTTPVVHSPVGVYQPQFGRHIDAPLIAELDSSSHDPFVIIPSDSDLVYVLRGKGDGTFPTISTTTPLKIPDGDIIGGITFGDLDGDGNPDLVTAGSGTLDVFGGNGDGSFGSSMHSSFDSSSNASGVTTADLDGDDKLDVVLVRKQDPAVWIFAGNGTLIPDQVAQKLSLDGNDLAASAVQVADLNGDKLLDIVVASAAHNGVVVFLQQAGHTYAAGKVVTLVLGTVGFELVDLDHDGILDIASVGDGGLYTEKGVGDGTFTLSQKLVTGVRVDAVHVADLTADGHPDIVAVSAIDNQLLAFQNLGTTFGMAQKYAAGPAPIFVTTGDVNGDGKPDVLASSFGNGVDWVRNITP